MVTTEDFTDTKKEEESSEKKQEVEKRRPLWFMLVIDLLMACFFLLGFAYIHHGHAYLNRESMIDLSAAQALPTAFVSSPSKANDTTEDIFTEGDIQQTASSYKSTNVNISWERREEEFSGKPAVYYVVDIYVRSPEYLCTALAPNGFEDISELANTNNAIVAINGDFALARGQGPVVRDGKLLRNTPFGDVLVMYNDGSMATFSARDFDIEKEAEKGVENVWSFGPGLLDSNGKALSEYNTTVVGANPRTAIGYFEPCHYCFVVVDGRGEEGSDGMKMQALSKVFEELGCSVAYNLDGGQSSFLAWDLGETIVNSPAGGGRLIGDIIYIPKV